MLQRNISKFFQSNNRIPHIGISQTKIRAHFPQTIKKAEITEKQV